MTARKAADGAPKKRPARKAPAKGKKSAGSGGRRKAASVAERAAKEAGAKGGRLPTAKQQLRDSLIYQRYLQRWTWRAIAAEAGISVRRCQQVVEERRKIGVALLNIDPVALVEDLIGGFMASAGDFEAIAHAHVETHPSAAVGARKAADDARSKAIGLLQDTGRFPRDLGTLRHLIDLRAIAGEMLIVMQRFQRGEVEADEVVAVFLRAAKLDELPTAPDALPPGFTASSAENT